jgi:hypothetical protein
MPLTPPAERRLMHQRDIVLRGYERLDGLFDIEAELADTKTYGFANEDRGNIEPGEKLHGMVMRFTVDDTMEIVAAEAATEFSPYAICPVGAASFARLAGLRIGRGFLKHAAERVGGAQGCTHLRELLQQMATVALQTIQPILARRREARAADPTAAQPSHDAAVANRFGGAALVNSCAAFASDTYVVKRRWPELYTGS